MMLTSQCSECGEKVAVPPQEVRLWKRPDGCNLLRFTCPVCGRGSGGCPGGDALELLLYACSSPIFRNRSCIPASGTPFMAFGFLRRRATSRRG